MFGLTPFRSNYYVSAYDPFKEMEEFERRFFGQRTPAMKTDIRETENAYILESDLPGFSREDIHAEIKNGYLTIRAERKTGICLIHAEDRFDGSTYTKHRTQLSSIHEIQANIFKKALDYRNSMITKVDTWEEFQQVLNEKGGFISAHWDGTPETEQAIKDATKATIRCIPMDVVEEEGTCVFSGKPSKFRVLFAKSY